jgi:hypothetical protein
VTRRGPKRSTVWRLRSYTRPVAPPQRGALSGTCRFTFLASLSKSPKVQILSPQPVFKSLKTFHFERFLLLKIWLEISLLEAAGGKSQRKIAGRGGGAMIQL